METGSEYERKKQHKIATQSLKRYCINKNNSKNKYKYECERKICNETSCLPTVNDNCRA